MKRSLRNMLIVLAFLGIGIGVIWQNLNQSKPTSIRLRWVKAYPEESWDQVRTGIAWSLSFLGANLPEGSLNKTIVRIDSSQFWLNLEEAGFSDKALDALSIILDTLQRSEEYSQDRGIDLGRFLVITLHSSYHYYEITGVEKHLQDFINHYDLDDPKVYAVQNSSVAKGIRLIKFKETNAFSSMAFIAVEGKSSSNLFEAEIFEVLDFMKNGQLRFAVYDRHGELISASPQRFGLAGKPSKCLWCHEVHVLPLYTQTDDLPGYCSQQEFLDWVKKSTNILGAYRDTLQSEINFARKQDHTQSELLYISFMEPSKYRLCQEWQADSISLESTLRGFQSHRHEEFGFLGDLYERQGMDSIAPYKSIGVPHSVREANQFEPNFISLPQKAH